MLKFFTYLNQGTTVEMPFWITSLNNFNILTHLCKFTALALKHVSGLKMKKKWTTYGGLHAACHQKAVYRARIYGTPKPLIIVFAVSE